VSSRHISFLVLAFQHLCEPSLIGTSSDTCELDKVYSSFKASGDLKRSDGNSHVCGVGRGHSHLLMHVI